MTSVLASTPQDRLRSWLWRICLTLVAAGFLFLYMPLAPLKPLIERDQWIITSGFFDNSKPDERDVDPSISRNWKSRFLRSWSPEGGAADNAEMRSVPFPLPDVLVIPFVGYPLAKDVHLDLYCTTSKQSMPIATGNAHETWSQRILTLPKSWCKGRVQIVATSKSKLYYVGVGTPYKGSRWMLLKYSVATLMQLHMIAFVLLVLPIAMLAWRLRRAGLAREITWPTATALFGLFAYSQFFLIQMSRSLGACLSLGLYLWCAIELVRIYTRGQSSGISQSRFPTWEIGVAYAFSLFAALFLEMVDTGAGVWNAAYRFLPATWSSDHILPRQVAEGLYARKPFAEILMGSWHVSDRPPLLSALQLVTQPLIELLGAAPATLSLYHFLPKFIGIVAASGLPIALIHFVARLRTGYNDAPYRLVTVVLLVLFSPFVLFNSVYTWPKLMTAFLAMAGLWMLVSDRSSRNTSSIAAGLLFGLALLSHAGVAFGLLALPIFVRLLTAKWLVVRSAIAATVAVICWIPWSLWQKYIDPPGNALMRYALTGDLGFTSPLMPLTEAVRTAYADLTLQGWLSQKWLGLKNLFGVDYSDTSMDTYVVSWIGTLRLHDFLFVFPALRFLGLALLAALISAVFLPSMRARTRNVALLTLAGLTGIAVNILATWSVHINHHQSYLSVVALLLAGALALLVLPRWLAIALTTAQIGYVMVVWMVHPIYVPGSVQITVVFGVILATALLTTELKFAFRELTRIE
jgi:hypothetical protein